jgi:protein gp37
MGFKSNIEWCDHTFNGWIGCTKVSPACDNCYAERDFDKRRKVVEWGPGNPRKRTSEKNWNNPIRWNRLAEEQGVRFRVFGGSLMDWADAEVPDEWRADLWKLIAETPHLDWLMLTKRHSLIMKSLPDDWGDGYPNVWMGVSVEDQKWADQRIPYLVKVPAAVRWLSCEPLLGRIDLAKYMADLHWVVGGGESGPESRPMLPPWIRTLRDQCADAEVPFLMKQWGEWAPYNESHPDYNGHKEQLFTDRDTDVVPMMRIGKKAAGRTVDGRTWDQFPGVHAGDRWDSI